MAGISLKSWSYSDVVVLSNSSLVPYQEARKLENDFIAERPPRCSRHLKRRPSAIPGLLVGLHLKPIQELVQSCEEVHHLHHL